MNTSLKKRSVPSSEKGFTLIEIMIASAIFIIGAAGTLSVITTANNQYTHQRLSSQGISTCEYVMDELLMNYDLAAGIGGPRCFDKNGAELSSCGNEKYKVSWNVTANNPIPGMNKVVVYTKWKESGHFRGINLQSYRK